MKRIGVTGAFGFLGANFIAALLEGRRSFRFSRSEVQIVAFASRTLSNPLFDPSDVKVESLDILDYEDMVREFQGLDAVAHFAGRVDYRSSSRRAVWDTDVLGTKFVFDAALEAGVPKVLYVSSICSLGSSRPGAPVDESSSPYGDPSWPISFASPAEILAAVEASAAGDYRFMERMRVAYLDAKLAGWELAKLYAREKALPIVTIFPGTAVGAGDLHHAISKLIDNVWDGRLRFSFEGSTSFMDARDLGRGAALALSNGRVGEGYIIAGREEHNLGYAEFMDLVAALARSEGYLARRRPPVLPRPLLLGIAAAAELALPNGSLSRAFVLSGSLQNVGDGSKAHAELGYEPSPRLEPAILECRRFSEAVRASTRRPWLLPFVQHLLPQGLGGSTR
jgi:dihydroflavonol-4-reductase